MKRSKFSLSHHKLFTCDMGELVPCGIFEVLPGDSIQQATSVLVRTTPLLAPMMANVDIRVHHWFVPYRLVWTSWEDFITGGPDGENASVPPYHTTVGSWSVGSLGDYIGYPTGVVGLEYSVLPLRAYGLIWNEWYRDQDLQNPVVVNMGSGADSGTNSNLLNVAWEKDYFTSSRPWPQKGPEITIPLGGDADVVGDGVGGPRFVSAGGGTIGNLNVAATGANQNSRFGGNASASGELVWDDPHLVADLSSATAVSINALREAFALQRFAEARARYGSRYTEYLRYLGVRSSDARLQRPEYLGGGRQRLQVSEVLQTGVTTDGDDSEGVGNLKGHGIGAMRSNRYRRFFEEHGVVLSLFSVKPRTVYVQGLRRMFSRKVKEDYWQKELQHVGQQEVLKQEIYAAGGSVDKEVWGYQDRYDEYRRIESGIAGEFRTTLDFWHMARIFAGPNAPTLNSDFIKANPTDRVYAVGGETDALQVMCNHSIQARRMVAKTGSSFIF